MSFYFDEAGDLKCEKVKLESLVTGLEPKTREISIPGNSYAAKANGNLEILKILRAEGVRVLICVSGHEVLAGLKAGFPPADIILNGNGKQEWEIKLGISLGVVINVDSDFDAERIVQISLNNFPTKKVRVLLRLKPADPLDCTVPVHPYVNTSGHSKFGFSPVDLEKIVGILRRENSEIQIYGLQCHLGSCIYDPQIYAFISQLLIDAAQILKDKWSIEIELIDMGGGFAIDYAQDIQGFPNNNIEETDGKCEVVEKVPSVQDFVQKLSEFIPKDKKWTILLEPGRSLVGSVGLLLTRCLGVKGVKNGSNYLVVDASMTDLIRPCLYGAKHKIYPTKISTNDRSKWVTYDVVGPVCETSDFLGKNIQLPDQKQNQSSDNFVAIMDSGAYGSTMSSNYNMRPRIAEVLIDGAEVKLIRERDTFEDLLRQQVTCKKY